QACVNLPLPINEPDCGADEWMLNGACVTKNQWCQATYGPNIHPDGDNCNCDAGYNFVNNACVPEPKQTITPPLNPGNNDAEVVLTRLLKKIGYTGDITQIGTADVELLASALQYENLKRNKTIARLKQIEAEAALAKAFEAGNAHDPIVQENIRQMYLDSWLDDPLNPKTNMMLALLERERNNISTADLYRKFAHAGLSQSEQNALSSGAEIAKIRTLGEIFHEKEIREKEVAKTWQDQELKKSSLMNQMKNEIGRDMASAQEATKEICNKIKPCNWAYAKKVEIMTKAQDFSKKVSEAMNDPLKKVFGFDIKKMANDLGGQETANEKQ
ncbi:MAG: hypothetical protein Q7R94_02910, partial [bacterium]|nr:hypothetical protein [bacterium]